MAVAPEERNHQRLALLGLIIVASSLVIEVIDKSDSDMGNAFLIPALIGYAGVLLALFALANGWSAAFGIAAAAAGFGGLLYVYESLHREASWSEVLLAFVWIAISAALARMHLKKSG